MSDFPKEICCTFTGHRAAKLPWGFDESDTRCLILKQRIYAAVEAAYEVGHRHYICGMANGGDMYFGEAVLQLREKVSDVTLEAAIPCPEQPQSWPEALQERYYQLLAKCDYWTVISETYTTWCMIQRNHYMVDSSSCLIAAYRKGKKGGTTSTLTYAIRCGVPVIEIPIEE